jgi:hypothetical protein
MIVTLLLHGSLSAVSLAAAGMRQLRHWRSAAIDTRPEIVEPPAGEHTCDAKVNGPRR